MKFRTEKSKDIVVTLEENPQWDSVRILLNGKRVGWFSSAGEKLYISKQDLESIGIDIEVYS